MTRLVPGLHVHPVTGGNQRQYSSDEKAWLDNLLYHSQPNAILVLDNWEWAKRFTTFMPDTLVVFRKYMENPHEGDLHKGLTPQQFFDLHSQYKFPGIVLNIGNEPGTYDNNKQNLEKDMRALARWYSDILELFGNAGIPVVVSNFGVGHPNEEVYGWLDPLWRTLHKWRNLHYLGIHEYWSYRGIEAGNGRVLRHVWLWDYVHNDLGLDIQMLVTEFGMDDLLDGSGFRGFRSTGMNGGSYGAQVTEATEKYYRPYPYIKGVIVFCAGNTGKSGTGDDWSSFDVLGDNGYSDVLIAYAKDQEDIPVEPKPENFFLKNMVVSGRINLRSEPKLGNNIVGGFDVGSHTVYVAENAVKVDGYTWVGLKDLEGMFLGFVASEIVQFEAPHGPPQGDNNNMILFWQDKLDAAMSLLEELRTSIEEYLAE